MAPLLYSSFNSRFNPQLDLIIQDPPKNPKKVLFEMCPGKVGIIFIRFYKLGIHGNTLLF